MRSLDAEGDAAAALLERRWFASMAAVRARRAECEVLREVMTTAEDAWRAARKELARLESLCDALGEALDEREAPCPAISRESAERAVSSAA